MISTAYNHGRSPLKPELLLLRHGKSDWSIPTLDFDRPLKNRGIRGANRIGVWLLQNNAIPDHILSSPAKRAMQTAQQACKSMGLNAEIITEDERIYDATIQDLMDTLRNCPQGAQRVLMVGHNPGLESLLLSLTRSTITVPDDGKLLPTATLARLELAVPWANINAAHAELLSIIRARNLAEKFT